jgi:hypothetical protein
MIAGHKSTLVTTIMSDIMYHMTLDLLVANRSCPKFAFIYKRFVLCLLLHFYSFRVLPFAVTISKVNLNLSTMSMRDKYAKLPKWV